MRLILQLENAIIAVEAYREGTTVMTQLLERLTARGYKITPQRRLILQILKDSNRHLTAEEVAERINELQPGISIATIYRNLNILVDIRLLSKLDLHQGPARYEVNQKHDHHMVCLDCGVAIKLGVCPMQGTIQKIIDQNGFQVDSHHFEVIGYCKECQLKRQHKNKLQG
jgi:Fe2+ or Zn2+ uptake regulation protein